MSDVSVLSHEYRTASELSQALNGALITLKKRALDLPGASDLTSEDLQQSRACLADILRALARLLAPEEERTGELDPEAAARVPAALIARLRQERQGDLPYLLEDLDRIAAQLQRGEERLSSTDLARLDELAAVADAETSSVYRRLMRI
jgi:hypothetical protein